jgi:hypothetical protein
MLPEGYRAIPMNLLFLVRITLNISWDNIRACLRPLQSLIGQDMQKLVLWFQFLECRLRDYQWDEERKGIIVRWIQVLQDIGSGEHPTEFWTRCVLPSIK